MGPGRRPLVFFGRDSASWFQNLTNAGDGNTCLADCRHKRFTTRFTAADQQAAGADQPQGINIQQLTDFTGLSIDGNSVHIDFDPMSAGNAKFLQSGGQPAFCDIVHGACGLELSCNFSFCQDTDVGQKLSTDAYF